MAIIIGVVGMIVGVAGIIIGWVALTKVQALSVAFVKSHIQGLRTETAKNTAAINTIVNRLAVLDKAQSSAKADESETKIPPPAASAH